MPSRWWLPERCAGKMLRNRVVPGQIVAPRWPAESGRPDPTVQATLPTQPPQMLPDHVQTAAWSRSPPP